MAVPNFDAVEQPEPLVFRLLGREWECQPVPTEEAVTVARMGHVLAPFDDTDPAVYAAVLADLALRFVAWSVVDQEQWLSSVSGAQIPAATIIDVMAWLSGRYTSGEAPTVSQDPLPARPAPSVRRTDLDSLQAIAQAAGLGDVIARS